MIATARSIWRIGTSFGKGVERLGGRAGPPSVLYVTSGELRFEHSPWSRLFVTLEARFPLMVISALEVAPRIIQALDGRFRIFRITTLAPSSGDTQYPATP